MKANPCAKTSPKVLELKATISQAEVQRSPQKKFDCFPWSTSARLITAANPVQRVSHANPERSDERAKVKTCAPIMTASSHFVVALSFLRSDQMARGLKVSAKVDCVWFICVLLLFLRCRHRKQRTVCSVFITIDKRFDYSRKIETVRRRLF